MLRRTKSQKSTLTGKDLVELPAKHVQEHRIALGQEERRVYQEVFNFAQGAMETYMAKQKVSKSFVFCLYLLYVNSKKMTKEVYLRTK